MTDSAEDAHPPVTQLTKAQRRVLGVLSEKAFTTPDAYPLTLKALTTGCNQKSNRAPTVNYSEEDVLDVMDELRQMGLAAVVHTETGRTERFRHYFRRRFTFTEPQLAILTELLLRGRQTQGELRARASRMVPIDSLSDLRAELRGLMDENYVQSDGPLDRRGVEVDHNLYEPREGNSMSSSVAPKAPVAESAPKFDAAPAQISQETTAAPSAQPAAASSPATVPTAAVQSGADEERLATLTRSIEELRTDNRDLRAELEAVRDEFRQLSDRFDDLRSDLGG